MRDKIFINIDGFFLIKESISIEVLNKCYELVARLKGIEKNIVEKAYKNNTSQIIDLPKTICDEGIDIVIKTKFNEDYKFINLNKSALFYEYNNMNGLNIDKINQFNLTRIKFFPPTYLSGNIIFQELAKGVLYRPNKLSDLRSNLLTNISQVIKVFSSLEKRNVVVAEYLANLEVSCMKDPLNSKIINSCILILKSFKHESLETTLTHGDFKFEHLFTLESQLEYLIDWENVDLRSVFFDLMNFFVPWFVRRSYNYIEIKNYIHKFIKNYLPHLLDNIKDKYDLFFSVFVLERYVRINSKKNFNFNKNEAYKRFNLLFQNLTNELTYK